MDGDSMLANIIKSATVWFWFDSIQKPETDMRLNHVLLKYNQLHSCKIVAVN